MHELHGDGGTIVHNVLTNDLRGDFGVLEDGADLVELGEVQFRLVDSLAEWEGVLNERLSSQEREDKSTEAIGQGCHDVFVFSDGLLYESNTLIELKS